jgi:hypothetical protein
VSSERAQQQRAYRASITLTAEEGKEFYSSGQCMLDFFLKITWYNVNVNNTHAYSALWTHVRKPYLYKHFRRTELADLEIHEVWHLAVDGDVASLWKHSAVKSLNKSRKIWTHMPSQVLKPGWTGSTARNVTSRQYMFDDFYEWGWPICRFREAVDWAGLRWPNASQNNPDYLPWSYKPTTIHPYRGNIFHIYPTE